MLLTCPKCETIFRVDSQNLNVNGQTVRCSICSHVWFALPPKSDARPTKSHLAKKVIGWNRIGAVVFILLLLGAFAGGFVHQRVTVTAYFPGLVPGFDLFGMKILSKIEELAVIDLKAAHTGDILRLGGRLQNNSAFDAHAADLLVTVTSADGTVINEQTVTPDDRIITAGGSTPFFVQMSVESLDEASVTVLPIAKQIIR